MRAQSRQQAAKSAAGFTLIELLIVMVIVAVLAGIAYPAYTGHIKRSHRADARAELLRMQMAVEKQRLTTLGAKPALPAGWVVAQSVAKHYQLNLPPAAAQDYTLEARALAGDTQAEDKQGETSCAVLTLRVQGMDTRYEPAVCWQ